MNADRLARVRANLRALGLSQMLLVDPLSIWWLCGYYTEPYERFFALYVSCDESRGPVMFCNRLFPEVGDACADVRTFDDTEDPVALVADACDRGSALGVDKELAARWLVPLMEAGAAASFRLASGAVDDARSIKDARERELMRAASLTNDKAMEWLVAQIRPGVTERQIADGLLGEYRRLGASGHSFSPIVSFGDHGADPHHEPDDTPFELGDVVLFDVGCKQDWYCSDMTRTFFTAEPTEHQRRVLLDRAGHLPAGRHRRARGGPAHRDRGRLRGAQPLRQGAHGPEHLADATAGRRGAPKARLPATVGRQAPQKRVSQ